MCCVYFEKIKAFVAYYVQPLILIWTFCCEFWICKLLNTKEDRQKLFIFQWHDLYDIERRNAMGDNNAVYVFIFCCCFKSLMIGDVGFDPCNK